jgi:hypothetical protein
MLAAMLEVRSLGHGAAIVEDDVVVEESVSDPSGGAVHPERTLMLAPERTNGTRVGMGRRHATLRKENPQV